MTTTSPRLYTTPDEIAAIRKRLNAHDWYARSFANLRAPADELLRRGIRIPREKGFVFFETCPQDNTPLRQDPFNPRDHVCPTCGENYTAEPYCRAWVSYYQSYLAQRAVEMGIAYQITGDDAYAAAIRYVLGEYAHHYAEYPLADCVLGPTRLFQSTYIESLWLACLAAAADLARGAIPSGEWRFLRDHLFLPAAEVIRDYDEGDNNRQAMNNAALGLAGVLCDEPSLVAYAVDGPHGWRHHLAQSVLADGLWYEGDNYHFATLPAMANLADALSRNGLDLYRIEAGQRRFKQMFDAPLLDLYPDLTFPARKDSRFASPVGQRWYAGLYELGYRQYRDPAYARLLRRIYAEPPAVGDVLANAAGFIDVWPGEPADRARLDWRGFLNAVPDLDAEPGIPVRTSVNMAGTGLGILRQDDGRTYAALDYGHFGGGHGHPDRLQLNFYARGKPWCVDWGTGNYYFDHLRWYRSSLAHNTVVVDGKTQAPVTGTCRHFGATPAAQVVSAAVDEVYPGVSFRRTAVLLSPDLLLDLFDVESEDEHQLDWALHAYGTVALAGTDAPPAPAAIRGEHYEWLHDVHRAPADTDWTATFSHDGDALALHMLGAAGTAVYTAAAYGAPPAIPQYFWLVIARRTAARTTFATLFEHRAGEQPIVGSFGRQEDGACVVTLRDGTRYVCRSGEGGQGGVRAGTTVTHFAPDGSLVEASGFGAAAVPGAFAAEFPLEQVYLRIEGGTAHLTAPERFGQIRVDVPGVTRVAVNGEPAVPGDRVRQHPAAWASLSGAPLCAGVPNTLDLTLFNERDAPLRGDTTIELPVGWSLAAPAQQIDVAPWSVRTYPLRCVPGPNPGVLRVSLTGDEFPLHPLPPITIAAWFPNLAGPTLRVRVVNNGANPAAATLTVGSASRAVAVERTVTLDFPIAWTDAERGLAIRAICGEHEITHEARIPVARIGQGNELAAAAQLRRGERRWGGPHDLSARFRVERTGSALRLRIAVNDDVVKANGPVEQPFDYDSVQVYFDPRPDRARADTTLTGVVGLLLIPAAGDQPARIVPIGPVAATLVSSDAAPPNLDDITLTSQIRPDGYDLDLSLPLPRLGCEPRPGDKLGFDLIVNDNDGAYRRAQQMIWTGAGDSRIWLRQDYHPPQQYGALVF